MERYELENLLDNGKTWECFCNDVEMVKRFVSNAYNGIDFDTNFELREIKTVFGTKVSVKKK